MATFDPNEPLRWNMILPNGEPLRWGMKGARWNGTVGEVMAALAQEQQPKNNPMLALSTTLLTTEELTTICARISPLWTPLFTAEPLLAKIATAADANCAAIITSGTRQTSSDFTEPLKTADDARDAAFTSLRDLVATATTNPLSSADQRAAGARLQEIIERQGNRLWAFGYTRQTGKMQTLINDLGADQATADLALLGLTALFTHLTEKQAAFEQIIADKAAAEGGTELPTVRQNRPLLEHRTNLLLDALIEMNALDPSPALTTALGQIEELIDSVMAPALARRTRAAHAAAAPAPTPA